MRKVIIKKYQGTDKDIAEFNLDELLENGEVIIHDNKGWLIKITMEEK